MRKSNFVKNVSIILIVILISNLILFAFRKINPLLFWIIIMVIALIAYKGLPKKSTKP